MSLFDLTPLGHGAYGQALRDDPPPVARCNPTVAEPDVPRLSKQHHAILAMLRAGPATNVELSAIGQRFGARIHELRDAGFAILREQLGPGLYRYTLHEATASEAEHHNQPA